MNSVTIKYREKLTPGFPSEFIFIDSFKVKSEETIGFIRDTLCMFYLYHSTDNFEGTILDVWAEIESDGETKKISWEDSDESDFRLFYTNLK